MEIGLGYDLRPDVVPLHGPDDRLEEYESQATVDAVAAALRSNGHDVRCLGGGRAFLDEVLENPPELVFNMAEGTGGRPREAHVSSICEMLGIPRTEELTHGLQRVASPRQT